MHFICEGEDKEDDQKSHLDLVRKTIFNLLELLYKCFKLLSCFEDLVQRGSGLVFFFFFHHPFPIF